MYELVTISNGVVVVQHAPSGQVYRFRPVLPGVWDRLLLDRVDPLVVGSHLADAHANGALSFAERAAADVLEAVAGVPRPNPSPHLALPEEAGRPHPHSH